MGKLVTEFKLRGHKGRIYGVAWHPAGNAFASCGKDKTIRIWSPSGSSWTTTFTLSGGHKRTIREVTWSPCGLFLASASFDGTVGIWSKDSGWFESTATLEGYEKEVTSVAWSNDFLATCSRDKTVVIWEYESEDDFDCVAVLDDHSQDVKRVVWHPTEDVLASASYDTIKMYAENDSVEWECTATLSSHGSTVWSIDFDEEGERLVSCSDDKTLKIWRAYEPGNEKGIATPDEETVWKCVCTISVEHEIYDVAWSKKTGLIATACGDYAIRIFKEDANSQKNEPLFSLILSEDNAHLQNINSIKWNPAQSDQLISCSDDGTIKIWKYTSD